MIFTNLAEKTFSVMKGGECFMKIDPKKIVSFLACGVVAFIAFKDEREKQKQEEELEEIKGRLAALESDEESE
jgi:hypothetical protein